MKSRVGIAVWSALLLLGSQLSLAQQNKREWIGGVSFQLSQIGTTQSQQTYGGQVSVANEPHREHYCGSNGWSANIDLMGSHNVTSQSGSPSITLDSDDDSLSATRWIKPATSIGARAEAFLNNSLGVGLEQIYALTAEQVVHCEEPGTKPTWQFFKLAGDVRYVRERLYVTPGDLNLAGISVGEQYLIRRYRIDPKTKKRKSLFTIREKIAVTPMVNDLTALQAAGDVKVSLPLAVDNLSFSVEEQEHYFGNAPHGFDKHYQQTTLSINYTFGGTE